MSATPLRVVIATAGRAELLGRTLASIADCRRPEGFAGVVVVENGPPGGAEKTVAAAHPQLGVEYVYRERANKSAALNHVLESLDGQVFFTDDDVRLTPETLCAHAAAEASAGPQHFFGGPMGVDYERAPDDWLRHYLPASAVGWEPEAGADPRRLVFLGCNWSARVRDVIEVGGFDPERGPGSPRRSVGQESDLQRRLLARGFASHYVAESFVWHWVPAERCSEEWVLERTRRYGVYRGQERARESRFGWPLREQWALGRAWLGARVAAGRGGAESRFRRERRLRLARGTLEGYRQQRALPG